MPEEEINYRGYTDLHLHEVPQKVCCILWIDAAKPITVAGAQLPVDHNVACVLQTQPPSISGKATTPKSGNT